MADTNGSGEAGKSSSGKSDHGLEGDDLDRRRRQLEASLAARVQATRSEAGSAVSKQTSGYGQALRLSSEFVAAVLVGSGLGWVIDSFAGTSPWGIIVFLLLGFVAGVLNVMRSAGLVAQAGIRKPEGDRDN